MFEQTVAADEVVIEQGADGDFFYVVDKGVYHALIKTKEGEPLLKVFKYNSQCRQQISKFEFENQNLQYLL